MVYVVKEQEVNEIRVHMALFFAIPFSVSSFLPLYVRSNVHLPICRYFTKHVSSVSSPGGRGSEVNHHDVRIGFSEGKSDLQLGEDKHSYGLSMMGKRCTQKHFAGEPPFCFFSDSSLCVSVSSSHVHITDQMYIAFSVVFVPDGINSVGDYNSRWVGVVVVVVCLSPLLKKFHDGISSKRFEL